MINETTRAFFNSDAPLGGPGGAGDQLKIVKNVVRGTYDFSVLGGAIGTVKLLDQAGVIIPIPNKAIITDVYIDVVTGMTSTGGTGTIAIGLNSTGDLLAAVDADTLSNIVAGIPIGTAATMVKATADRYLTATIATATLTAGKIEVFAEYVLSE